VTQLYRNEQAPLFGASSAGDAELERVFDVLLAADPTGTRFASALRRTFDMLLDGQHTGRYRWDQLMKTEKTHAGTVVEINLQREFKFAGGDKLDYRIGGVDVDCKYSQKLGSWMIPPEAVGRLCLLVWASDQESRWCAGLVRADEALLNTGANRDGKRSLNSAGRTAIRWLFSDAPLMPNVLLHLPQHDIDAIFSHNAGTKRLDELFRRALKRRIGRAAVATVAQQEDYMRRARANGGSRTSLGAEGIVVFGQYQNHAELAERLGLPVPQAGEFVSARLAKRADRHGSAPAAEIDGSVWVVAGPEDPVEPAPQLPKPERQRKGSR
jgi:hypothetical protein